MTRLSLAVLGHYYKTLGDPLVEAWAGLRPGDPRTLAVIDKPLAADLVFYQRPGNPKDPADRGRAVLYHVAVSDGAGKVIAACDKCDHVVEHTEQCPHARWTHLKQPYRRFPIPASTTTAS